MFCINCGSQQVDTTTQGNEKLFIERGEYNEAESKYKSEYETVALECSECGEEMCRL
ncbi:hypothetical protein AAFX24_27645 [Vibrio mediterranei]|uniref:hypothetical protein n=1 Tax=Vibrio mediterranei TaxID=689 RepID=UPI0038CF06F3